MMGKGGRCGTTFIQYKSSRKQGGPRTYCRPASSNLCMKKALLLTALLVGLATSSQAGVGVSIGIGVPLPGVAVCPPAVVAPSYYGYGYCAPSSPGYYSYGSRPGYYGYGWGPGYYGYGGRGNSHHSWNGRHHGWGGYGNHGYHGDFHGGFHGGHH
jgi:hypothetical protein